MSTVIAETGNLVSLDIMVSAFFAVRGHVGLEALAGLCYQLKGSDSLALSQEINPSISSTDNDVKQTVDVGRALVRAALGETLL